MDKRLSGQQLNGILQDHPYKMAAVWFCIALLIPLIFREPALALYRSDTFEYLRGADSLFAGKGFLASNGSAQTLFPPGYSLSIASLKFIIPSTPMAAVVVSLLTSAASVALVYLIARAWLGWQNALFAALLFAFYPLRVWLAQSALSESLEVMLVLAGIYLLASNTLSLFRAIAAGVLLGLGYLTRPEALAIVLGLVAWMLILWVRKEKRFFLFAVALSVMFLTVAPYWLWFQARTGSWSFSGKSSVIKLGLLRDETTQDIEWRLLNDTQTEIQVPDPDFSPAHLLAHYARNVWRLKERIIANAGIEPFASFLLVWGLLCMVTFIFRRHAWGIGAFQLVLFAPFFVFPLFWVEDRFVYQISPVLALWIALGLVELHRWILQGWQEYKTIDRFLSTGVFVILLAAILASFVFRLATTNVNATQIQAAQEAAELLRRFAPDGNVGVISEYPAIAYFADARGEFTPNANLDSLRTFATAKRSQFIVIGNTDVRTEATKQLLDGDFAPAVAKRLGEVKREGLNWVLFFLYPQER